MPVCPALALADANVPVALADRAAMSSASSRERARFLVWPEPVMPPAIGPTASRTFPATRPGRKASAAGPQCARGKALLVTSEGVTDRVAAASKSRHRDRPLDDSVRDDASRHVHSLVGNKRSSAVGDPQRTEAGRGLASMARIPLPFSTVGRVASRTDFA